jgi:hypothetical protein
MARMFRTLRVGSSALLLAGLLTGCSRSPFRCEEPSPPPPGPFCAHGWCATDAAPIPRGNQLSSVAVVGAEVWAVGSARPGTGMYPCPEGPPNIGPPSPLVERWDGRTWSTVSVAVPTQPGASPTTSGRLDASGGEFTAIAASGPSDVWVAGEAHRGPTMLHFDGDSWSSSPLPGVASTATEAVIRAVATAGSGRAWAVGSKDAQSVQEVPLMLAWDGSRWSEVELPPVAYSESTRGHGKLDDVTAFSATDVWAVGESQSGTTQNAIGPAHPLALHWNGRKWAVVSTPPLPGALGNGGFVGVGGTGSSDLWAVGSRSGKRAGAFITLAEHWDGAHWSIVPTPNGSYGGGLVAVAAISSVDVWLIGGDGDGSTLTARWDGSRVVRVESPNVPSVGNYLHDAIVSGSGEVLAVGDHGYIGARNAALILRLRSP